VSTLQESVQGHPTALKHASAVDVIVISMGNRLKLAVQTFLNVIWKTSMRWLVVLCSVFFVLYPLLTAKSSQPYSLRSWSHNFTPSARTSSFDKCNLITRTLFHDVYWCRCYCYFLLLHSTRGYSCCLLCISSDKLSQLFTDVVSSEDTT